MIFFRFFFFFDSSAKGTGGASTSNVSAVSHCDKTRKFTKIHFRSLGFDSHNSQGVNVPEFTV